MQYGKPYLTGKHEQFFLISISTSVKLLMASPTRTFYVSLEKYGILFQPVHNKNFPRQPNKLDHSFANVLFPFKKNLSNVHDY